jgi:LysM repeat protein
MTNPNPFVPKGSLLEQQSMRRSRLKLGVFCVLAVSVTSLVAMLIQGCKREQPVDSSLLDIPTNTLAFSDMTNQPPVDTNVFAMTSMPTNTAAFVTPLVTSVIPETTPGTTYEVVKGDSLTTIAKAHHVTLKELQAANPGVDSKYLKLKQKIVIPAASAVAPSAAAPVAGAEVAGETYTVKSGDTLTTIAKKHGTTVKALQAANNLTTTKIKVNQKLKLPVKAEAAPVVPAAPATTEMAPLPPFSAPATTPVK